MSTETRSEYVRGFTLRSCLVILFGLVTISALVQFIECIEGSDAGLGSYALPIPVLWLVIPFILVSGLCYALTRFHLLTRAELLVTLFALSLATPLTSSAFWTMMVGAIGTIPKTADFETYDAWPPKLWPHGPNLIEGAFRKAEPVSGAQDRIATRGVINWVDTEYERGATAAVPVLENANPQDRSWVRVRVPVTTQPADPLPGDAAIVSEPYLLTVLLKPQDLGPEAEYYCRVYYDDDPHFATEAFTSRTPGERNYLHQTGFVRRGMYGLVFSNAVRNTAFLEFGLSGRGRLALADVELMGVGALDSIYQGRRLISRSTFERLREPLRTELLIKPDRWLSIEGLKFVLAGYVPWKDWSVPFIAWTSFAFLCLLGTFCVAVLMRRQWINSERYPLPMTRIPLALLGDEEAPGGALSAIWSNRMMWIGFALGLFWCLMKGWHLYNANVPDMNIQVKLTPYFTSPIWGKMWYGQEVRNITFTVTAIYLSLAIFMELNVLMSLVLGFFLFRAQYWFGEATGLALKKDFPFLVEQQAGAYITYALLILFFSRKHLWHVGRSAVSGPLRNREAFGYRAALLALSLSVLGVLVWSNWVDISPRGMLVFFAFLMLIALVSTKLRCECGTPAPMFSPANVAALIPLAGGMVFFGPAGVLFVIFANWIIFRYVFFLLPGMQLEMVELGRRFRLPPRHIVYTVLLGAFGGLVIGGWVFLSMGYALGGDNYTWRYPYMDKGGLVNDFHMEMAHANASLPPVAPTDAGPAPEAQAAAQSPSINPPMFGYLFAAVATAALTVLRQLFSGFWFHPIGFVVGSTVMMENVWGSVLVAFIIRAVTLKIGGAVVVRGKLMPFFVGVFLACLATYLIFAVVNGYLFFFYPSAIRESLAF